MSKLNILAAVLVALAWIGLGVAAALAQGSPPAQTDTTVTTRTSQGAEVLPPPVIGGQSQGCVTKSAQARNEMTGAAANTKATTCSD